MKNKKDVILLGSTGSIGESALRLLRENRDKFNLIGVSAHKNVRLLSEIVNEFDVPNVVLSDATNAKNYFGKNELNVGSLCLIDLAKIKCDIVISGITGMSGLHSAYSAIFQCLNKKNISNLDYITLTASGGPFLNTPIEQFKNIKPQDAVRHPVWKMGKKISVDSATMINKALEIIEASVLFNLTSNKIDVVVHPEHIIHGLVQYKDGSVMANLGLPDMITPLSVALTWPDRLELNLKKMSLVDINKLTFFKYATRPF